MEDTTQAKKKTPVKTPAKRTATRAPRANKAPARKPPAADQLASRECPRCHGTGHVDVRRSGPTGERKQAILAFVRDHDGRTLAEIRAAVPQLSEDAAKDRHATGDAVFRLTSHHGLLVKKGGGQTATYHLAATPK